MINVTENAKNKAIQLMSEDGKDGFFIRVSVKGGGCSGLMYDLDFDNVESENDKVFEEVNSKIEFFEKKKRRRNVFTKRPSFHSLKLDFC